MRTQQQYKLLIELLTNLLEIPVACWDAQGKICADIEQAHCFAPAVQAQLKADTLDLFCRALKEHCLYELQDRLGLRLILLRIEPHTLLVGPYVPERWNEERASRLLAQHGLPATQLMPYKLYYCAYRVLPTADVLHCIRAVVRSLSQEKGCYRHQVILGAPEEAPQTDVPDADTKLAAVLRRYEAENQMIHCLQKGDADGVRAAQRQASAASAGSRLRYIDTGDILAGSSITRTLMRKAAERAGVHPMVVDAISREYEQRAASCKSPAEIDPLLDEMNETFCAAVRTVKKENYSPVVRRAADYIRLNLSVPLRVERIAAVAGVSRAHLSRVFKAETGVSLTLFIAEQRCAKAAALLRTTDLAVQEISSYVGYLDNNYFVKVFRAHYRLTPTEYRHRHAGFWDD